MRIEHPEYAEGKCVDTAHQAIVRVAKADGVPFSAVRCLAPSVRFAVEAFEASNFALFGAAARYDFGPAMVQLESQPIEKSKNLAPARISSLTTKFRNTRKSLSSGVTYEGTLLGVRSYRSSTPDLPRPDRPHRSHPALDESRPYTLEIVDPTRLSRFFVATSIASRTLVLFENGYTSVKSMPYDRARSVPVPPYSAAWGSLDAL